MLLEAHQRGDRKPCEVGNGAVGRLRLIQLDDLPPEPKLQAEISSVEILARLALQALNRRPPGVLGFSLLYLDPMLLSQLDDPLPDLLVIRRHLRSEFPDLFARRLLRRETADFDLYRALICRALQKPHILQ